MFPLLLAVVLLSPAGALVVLLWRRREWRMLWAFGAMAVAIVAAAAAWGYQDYRSSIGGSPFLVDSALGMQVTLYAVLGAIVVDWIAVIWGGCYWLRSKGRAAHPTRADRRRQARRASVAGPPRGVTK